MATFPAALCQQFKGSPCKTRIVCMPAWVLMQAGSSAVVAPSQPHLKGHRTAPTGPSPFIVLDLSIDDAQYSIVLEVRPSMHTVSMLVEGGCPSNEHHITVRLWLIGAAS